MALRIEYIKEHHPIRWVLLIILIALLGAAGWFGYRWYSTGELPPIPLPIAGAFGSVDESDVASSEISSYKVPGSAPRYVSIPELNLKNSRIYPVSLDSDNFIKLPTNIHDVTWYETSGQPGDGGVVLLNGYNKGVSTDGAFAALETLKRGDKITLERGDGKVFNYLVAENQSMSVREFTSKSTALMGKSAKEGTEGLNVTTFGGNWVPKLGTFEKRVILRAVITNN